MVTYDKHKIESDIFTDKKRYISKFGCKIILKFYE